MKPIIYSVYPPKQPLLRQRVQFLKLRWFPAAAYARGLRARLGATRVVSMVTVLVALAIALCRCTCAQVDTATLTGRVTDSFGNGVEAARVDLVDDRNIRLSTRTTSIGSYTFAVVRPGNYRLQVSAPGYRSVDLKSLTLYTQSDVQQNFRLARGTPGEPVIVMSQSTPVDTTGAVATVVPRELLGELPLNGRSFQTLFQLTPGIVITPTSFASQGQFSVNGQRTDTNYFVVDGVSANFGIAGGVNPGQTAGGWIPALSVFGSTNTLASTDAVQEFAVLTSSYSAEFGRVPGAQVSIVTRSGTHKLSGSVYEYLRNDALDANDWFANHENLPRAALRQNDFGGVLGGPITKGKTFVFASFEGLQLRQPTSSSVDVPSRATRTSAPDGVKPFLQAYPLPNGPDEGNGLARATYGVSNPSSLEAVSFRVDRHFGESLNTFVRYVYSTSGSQQRAAGSNSLSTITDTHVGSQALTFGLTHFMSERIVNDLRFNGSTSAAASANRLDGFAGAVPLVAVLIFPSGFNERNSLFQFAPSVTQQTPVLGLGRNVANSQTQINVVDYFSYQVRSHLIKAGLDFRRLSPRVGPAVYQQQALFQDIQSALANRDLFVALDASVPVSATFTNLSAFGEDSWRVSPRLNVTFGTRWDWDPRPTAQGANGQKPFAVIGFNDISKLSLAAPGTPLYHSLTRNFAPRLGISYVSRRSTGTESVIKVGAGVYYDFSNGPIGNALSAFSFPFAAQAFFSGAALPLTPTISSPPPITTNPPFSSVQAFPAVLKTPFSYHWNLSFEQAIGSHQTFNISYVGDAGRRLLRSEEYVGGQAGVPTEFNQIVRTDNSGSSNFNSLQVKFDRRTGRLKLLASYSLSHSLDNVSTDETFFGIPARFLNPESDYGASDFDIRQTGTFGLDYGLGRSLLKGFFSGCFVDSIVMMRSAPPVNPVVSRDIGFGSYDFRPDLIPGAPLYIVDSNLPGGREINPEALTVPAAPRQGNVGRNFFRGFPLFQIDFALRRIFPMRRQRLLEIRVEAFNLFNRANFAPPAVQLGVVDPLGNFVRQQGFGTASSTLAHDLHTGPLSGGFSPVYQIGGARSLQLATRFEF